MVERLRVRVRRKVYDTFPRIDPKNRRGTVTSFEIDERHRKYRFLVVHRSPREKMKNRLSEEVVLYEHIDDLKDVRKGSEIAWTWLGGVHLRAKTAKRE